MCLQGILFFHYVRLRWFCCLQLLLLPQHFQNGLFVAIQLLDQTVNAGKQMLSHQVLRAPHPLKEM